MSVPAALGLAHQILAVSLHYRRRGQWLAYGGPAMYSSEEQIRAAMLANPHDAALHGAYADWLDEFAPERAEEAATRRQIAAWMQQPQPGPSFRLGEPDAPEYAEVAWGSPVGNPDQLPPFWAFLRGFDHKGRLDILDESGHSDPYEAWLAARRWN